MESRRASVNTRSSFCLESEAETAKEHRFADVGHLGDCVRLKVEDKWKITADVGVAAHEIGHVGQAGEYDDRAVGIAVPSRETGEERVERRNAGSILTPCEFAYVLDDENAVFDGVGVLVNFLGPLLVVGGVDSDGRSLGCDACVGQQSCYRIGEH